VTVHGTDPFATPPEHRSIARRLRGRLAMGVGVWTSGRADARTGLTISSMMLSEGSPSIILGLMNETTDLYDAINDTNTFVVHLLGARHRVIADRFAGLRPSPGGLFVGIEVEDRDWGPVMTAFPNRVHCRYLGTTHAGYQELVTGEIERIELDDLVDPLIYFRGRYRVLKPEGDGSDVRANDR
jgi:3-hydroxy-9,10-secoandrosta-1,3,5(10)-triene-9,17-dione monooxygenase reductase component